MNQTAEGLSPAKRQNHNRDLWIEGILAQYEHPLHRLAAHCNMDIIRA